MSPGNRAFSKSSVLSGGRRLGAQYSKGSRHKATRWPLSYLLVLQLDAHHPEGVVRGVVVDVDAAEALLARLDGNPFLTGVVVHHDGGPGLADALLTRRRGGE